MANDGELKFGTKIDTKGFEEGVDDLKKKGKQATDDFDRGLDGNEKSLVSLKNVAKIAGTYIAGSLFKDALTQGVQFNAQIEQYTTSFEVMTGSAEKATEVVERLKKIGSETPFELPQLAEVTQLLMNYGFTADEAIDRMNMLGDISQGNADKMNRIAMAYGQMSSAGKVSLEDIKQMIEAGFNPLQEISQTTGESMESLYDRISKGTISVDEITASMQRSTSEGGKYFQSMEKQSETLDGKISTLKDTWNNFLGDAVKPLSDFLEDTLIPALIEVLENFEKYEPVFTLVGIAVGTVTALLIAYNIQQALANANLTLWGAVCGFATGITTALGVAFTFLTSPIGLIIIAIGALIAIGYLLINNWETVSKVASDVWNYITEAFSNMASWFNDNVVKPIAEAFTNIYNAIVEIINTIISAVVNFAISVWQAIYNNIIVPITTIWSTWIQPVIDKIIEIISKLIEIIIALFLAFVNFINSSIIQPIISFFSNLFNSIVAIFTSLATWFNSSVVQPIISFFSDMFNSISSFAQGCWNTITGAFSSVATFFGNIFSVAYKKVTEAFSGIASFFSGIWDTIKTTFTNLGTNIANAIGGAVKSGINSIISMIEKTINTAIGLINGAIGIINYIPGVDIGKIDKLKMPRLEKGGILKKGQVGFLEGNGAEAVVPLDRNKYWIKAVAKEFDRNVPQTVTNNREQTINFYQKAESPAEISRMLRLEKQRGLIG